MLDDNYQRVSNKIWLQLARGDDPRIVIYRLVCAGWWLYFARLMVYQDEDRAYVKPSSANNRY